MANHKPKSYFEWGAGGSTRWIAAWASEKAISVDNFKPWCDKVLRDPVVKCMTEEGIFSQGCITPKDAQTGWGKMQHSDDNEKVSKAFINSIDTYNHSRYDTILVDGRFRQACALKALHYMDENSILLFHDFWSRWEKYDFVLEYFNPIGRSRTIGVLRRKPDEELPSDWKEAYLRYSTLQFQN
uniref:Uncharacterized protein n=1 Tax=Norrisiella sphaerica TaxID=552664 RepID=A0A7S2VUZ4_9EUKA